MLPSPAGCMTDGGMAAEGGRGSKARPKAQTPISLINQSREAHRSARPHHSPGGARQQAFYREPEGEAGGRAGVCPGLYDDPHRRSLTGGAHSSSRLAPKALTQSSR
jgi:hypothetical protein